MHGKIHYNFFCLQEENRFDGEAAGRRDPARNWKPTPARKRRDTGAFRSFDDRRVESESEEEESDFGEDNAPLEYQDLLNVYITLFCTGNTLGTLSSLTVQSMGMEIIQDFQLALEFSSFCISLSPKEHLWNPLLQKILMTATSSQPTKDEPRPPSGRAEWTPSPLTRNIRKHWSHTLVTVLELIADVLKYKLIYFQWSF